MEKSEEKQHYYWILLDTTSRYDVLGSYQSHHFFFHLANLPIIPTRVPGVVAICPGQLCTEGGEEVEERPRKNHNVRGGAKADDQMTGIAHAYKE